MVVTGAGARLVCVVVVVVVVGAGFSTTVVHETKRTARSANSEVEIISCFIIGVVFFTTKFEAASSFRCI